MAELDARNFRYIKTKKLIRGRIRLLLKYAVDCYLSMLKNNQTYSKSASLNANKTKYNLEEYLNEKLVEDYLSIPSNIQNFFSKYDASSIDTIVYFNYEPKQTYTEDDTRKDDFIDIKINDSALSTIWSKVEDRQIHFAIECKLIENGFSEYVSDINKMSVRNFNTPRLPFEAQIGYILNRNYTHVLVADGINKSLKNKNDITTTIKFLDKTEIHPEFPGSYTSIHKRNHSNQMEFSIYHLLFDYTGIVVE